MSEQLQAGVLRPPRETYVLTFTAAYDPKLPVAIAVCDVESQVRPLGPEEKVPTWVLLQVLETLFRQLTVRGDEGNLKELFEYVATMQREACWSPVGVPFLNPLSKAIRKLLVETKDHHELCGCGACLALASLDPLGKEELESEAGGQEAP